MALTADQIQARIDSLQAARDAGVMRVRHGDEYIDYKTTAEMDSTLNRLKNQLLTANATPRARLNYIEQTSKGMGRRGGGGFTGGFGGGFGW